jgi:hypothetical protein
MGFGINKFSGDGYVKEPTGSTDYPIFSSTGLLYSNRVPVNYFEDGSTAANLKAYGVSLLAASTAAGTMKKYTLDAPIKGMVKELILQSTIAPMGSSDATQVMSGSSDIDIITYNSTVVAVDYRTIAMQTPYTYARLIGVSTSRWALTDFQSASTCVAYKALAGLSSGLSTGITST